jgi:beta-mannosidase
VLCGSSEVAQQAAMMGVPAAGLGNALFDRVLPELCTAHGADAAYVPSSPYRGAMPFHVGAGPSHYYGVGAYLRPLEDARVARVRFASECLAFSNVPDDASLVAWLGDQSALAHHPRFKERVPRDGGAGWDFADVTDHYVELLYGVEVRALRYADHERYLNLCRAATGEVMAHVQGSWRHSASSCRGALIWFLRDLWAGAGWGVLDSNGLPKAPYYYLKRAWAPLGLWIVDEGVDGLFVHVENDAGSSASLQLELELYRKDGTSFERAATSFELGGRRQLAFSVEALIGRFVDSSYAYRFGPPAHTLVAARLTSPGATETLAQAFYLPLGLAHEVQSDLSLEASAHKQSDGSYLVNVVSQRFAQSVAVEARGYLASDSYFHLAPRVPHRFVLRPLPGATALRAKLRPLNAAGASIVRVDASP